MLDPVAERTESAPRLASRKDREALFSLQAQLCRVLGHPRRLEILDLLADGEKTTAELLRALGISKVNLSQHLGVMRHVGLVESHQQGRGVSHRLAFVEIKDACRVIRELLAARLDRTTRLARSLGNERAPGPPRPAGG